MVNPCLEALEKGLTVLTSDGTGALETALKVWESIEGEGAAVRGIGKDPFSTFQ